MNIVTDCLRQPLEVGDLVLRSIYIVQLLFTELEE